MTTTDQHDSMFPMIAVLLGYRSMSKCLSLVFWLCLIGVGATEPNSKSLHVGSFMDIRRFQTLCGIDVGQAAAYTLGVIDTAIVLAAAHQDNNYICLPKEMSASALTNQICVDLSNVGGADRIASASARIITAARLISPCK